MPVDWLYDFQSLHSALAEWFWSFIRIAAMLGSAPVIGSRLIPVRIRILLAVLVASITFPISERGITIDPLSFEGLITTLNQILIGLVAGFILQLVFNAIALAGEQIALTMGIGFAQMVDPQSGIQVPVISQFFVITSTLLFLSFNGHILLIQTIVLSFKLLPIGPEGLQQTGLFEMLQWASIMFTGAVIIALPAVIALLIVNLSMGVMTRASPQLNIFSVGFPVTILLGFGFILAWLPSYLPLFADLMNQGLSIMEYFIKPGI